MSQPQRDTASRLPARHGQAEHLCPQPKQLAGLSFGRDMQLHPAIQRWYLVLTAQSGIGKTNRELAVQV